MDLAGAVAQVVEALTAGGVRAAADLRDLNPPGVLVRPPEVRWRFGKDRGGADWVLWAIVPDAGTSAALAGLGELLEKTQAALGGLVVAGRPIDVQAVDGAGTLPAYELTFSTDLPTTREGSP